MGLKASWIEIPVKKLDRALPLYKALMQVEGDLSITDDGERKVVVLSYEEGGVGVSLNETANFEPSEHGPLVYFTFDGKLDDVVQRVEQAGGKIVIPKSAMGEAGFYATFKDTEGNVLALHAMQ